MSTHVLCGTPKQFCSGSNPHMSKSLEGVKVHADSEQAFKCYARYLVKERGYERIGSREFKPPEGYVLVLNKKSNFGGKLRKGKSPKKGAAGNRFMAGKRTGGMVY